MAEKSKSANRALTRDGIVALAIQAADRDGIEALSIRKLAAALSVTPMALYWHFENKAALLDAMAEQVASELEFTDDRTLPWQQRLRGVLLAMLAAFHAHPWMPRLVKGRIVTAPGYLRTLDALLDAIRTAGYDEHEAVYTVDYAAECVGAMAATLAMSTGVTPPPSLRQIEKQRHIAEMAASTFPRVDEAAAALTAPDAPQRHVDLGLEILVRGIEAAAPGARGPSELHRARARR